jgi:branched-chain amino acid transport system substrate-binding protein
VVKHHRWIIVGILVLMLASMVEGAAKDTGPIKIAFINSVTGEKALAGTYTASGVKMAVDAWNKKGGVLGREVKIITEDDAGTTSGAVAAFTKVVSSVEPVAVLAPIYSVMDLAMVPYMLEAKIPVVMGATNVKLTHQNNPWIFRIRANDGISTKLAAKFAVEELGAKTIGILHDSDEFGSGGAKMVAAAVPECGGKVVATKAYHGGDKDFSSQLLEFRKKNVDVIIAWGHAVEAGLVYRQKATLGIDIPIVGSPSWGVPVAIDLSEGAADGNYCIIDYISTDPDPRIQEFAKLYKDTYNLESEFYGASYYDGVNILLTAIEKAGSTEPEKIRQALYEIRDFQGIIGKYSFTKRGDGIHQVRIIEIKNGKPVMKSVVSGDPWEPNEEASKLFGLPALKDLPPLW